MTKRFWAISAGLALSLGCGSTTDAASTSDVSTTTDTTTAAGDTVSTPDVASGTDSVDAGGEDAESADTSGADGQDGAEDVGTTDAVDIGMTDAVDIGMTDDAGLDAGDGADVVTAPDVTGESDVIATNDVSADTAEPDAGPAPTGEGETCADAVELKLASEPTLGADYEHVLNGVFGASDDLNPFKDAGLAPACSIVYDAKGKEVVYAIDLSPGDILDMRYIVTPGDHPGGMYILDSCDPTTWPDYDKSGMCGSNEYKSQGYCGVTGQCDPIDFNFLYPDTYTQQKRFWIVLDEVGADTATSFKLYWTLIPAK